MRGKKINSIEKIVDLANARQSLVVDQQDLQIPRDWRVPAAFLQNWPGRVLYNLVKNGRVYEYKKRPAK